MNEMSIEYVRQLGTEELCQWLRNNSGLNQKKLDAALKVIVEQDIEGKNFLGYTWEEWMLLGLLGGLAKSLVQLAQEVLGSGASSVDGIVDVSFQLYNDLTTPFNSEPNLEELPAFLLTDPLVQFPVHSFTLKRLARILPPYYIEKIFRSSSTTFCDIDMHLVELAQMKVKLDSLGESTLHYYVDYLIKEVLQKILAFSGLVTHASRDAADFSSTTEPRTRPDFLFYVNQFLILRGEEKKSKGELNIAKRELVDKLKKWNVLTFGNLKYIFGFACGGEFFTFCAMSPSGMIFDVSRIFDLDSVVDRFEILICVINLARLFRTLAHRIPKGSVMMYNPIQRPNGCTIEIRDDYVLKRIPVSIHEFEKRFEYLNSLYDSMFKERVPHVIERWEISKSQKMLGGGIRFIVLKLKPCGLQITPSSQNLLLSALRSVLLALEGIHKLGYVHRDVRWPNLLCVTDEDWRLIDFENSSQGDSSLMKNDMRMVGKLMSCCESLFLSSEVLVYLREQLLSESPPNATEALAILAKIPERKSD